MRKWIYLCSILLLANAGLEAQGQSSLYAAVSGSVVYLQHEFHLKSVDSSDAELWRRFEKQISRPILDAPLPLASGSGFFIDTEGTILTNRHVVDIESMEVIRQRVVEKMEEALDSSKGASLGAITREAMKKDFRSMIDKSSYALTAWSANKELGPATIILLGGDEEPDLALVRVKGEGFKALKLAEKAVIGAGLVGIDVFSLGYPLGSTLDELFKERAVTMNRGNVSALRSADLAIQHSAAISLGNSGGPLVDSQGQVLGVNTAMLADKESNSLFYAIDSGIVRGFLEKKGQATILKWNSRLEDPMAADSGVKLNALGEFETSASLIVDVERNVEVWLDGAFLGAGPRMLTIATELGELELKGPSSAYSATIRLLPTLSGSTLLKPRLARRLSSVSFETQPSGATIRADGKKLGVTPFKAKLLPEKYALEFELEGQWFDDTIIEVASGTAPVFRYQGEAALPLTIQGQPFEKDAVLVFSSSRGRRSFANGLLPSLPAGDWTLSIEGSLAFEGQSIPARVGGGPLDLSSNMKTSSLKIYGLAPDSSLWIDGKSVSAKEGEIIGGLPLGVHTVQGWRKSWQPLEAVKITVRPSGDSFVTWDKLMGYDRSSSILTWSGLGLGLGGAAFTALGFYYGQPEVAIANTSNYDEYLRYMEDANLKSLIGVGALLGAAYLEYRAWDHAKKYRAQRKLIESLEAAK